MSHPLRWLALVALEEPLLPSFEHLAAWYGERFPDDPQPALANATRSPGPSGGSSRPRAKTSVLSQIGPTTSMAT